MGRREEFYILIGLIIAVLGCIGGWLALPQVQPWLNAQLQNPLFIPLVALAGIALALLLLVAFLLRDWIMAQIRAVLPKLRLETRYLQAVEQTYGTTPALLAGSEAASYSDLLLIEAFSPLTLRPDRDDGIGGISESIEVGIDSASRSTGIFLQQALLEHDRVVNNSTRNVRQFLHAPPRTIGERILYWSLRAIVLLVWLSAFAVAIITLLWSPDTGWRLEWQRIAISVIIGGLGIFGAIRLNLSPWLVERLTDLRTWWRRRSECIADEDTPGAEIWQHPRLLIRGDPGSGKTTLMRHIAVICARQRLGMIRRGREPGVRALYGWPECPFPIYIPLRALDLSGRDSDLLSAYGQKLRILLNRDLADCDAGFFTERLKRGGCLVLLDAFDELRDVETRTLAARLIAALPPGSRRRPNRFVVTSRIVGYEGQLNGASFVRRRVEELDEDQSAAFIRARYAAIGASERRALAQELRWDPAQQAENLIRRLPNNPGLRRLSRNPLLLSLTVALHHDHRGKGLQLPEERYRLYEEAIRLLVRDWERRKDVDVNLEPTDDRSDLTLDERLRLLRELAWMMFEQVADGDDGRAHAVVRGSYATDKLAEVLALIPGFSPEKSGVIRTTHARSEAERWRQHIGQRGGVLQELGNVPGTNDVEIQFAHLTFQEYLAARAAASEDSERRLARILERWNRPAWREVLLLYAASHNATPIIRHLLGQTGNAATLLAGAVLLERPTNLDRDLQERTLERLRALAFEATDAGEEQAMEALRQLEERAVLPKQAELWRIFQQAPHGPVRARALELALDRQLITPPRSRITAPAQPVPADLTPTLVHAAEHDLHYLPRLAAGYALSSADPRFAGNGWIPELVHVPAGPFLMGSSDADSLARDNEKPQHRLELPDFWIGKYPVTVAQWRRFAEDDGYANRDYWTTAGWHFIQGSENRPWYTRFLPNRRREQPDELNRWRGPESGDDNLPVTNVTWFEAVAYCRWLSAKTGHEFRLPTEAEWEKAARGAQGRIWPWGDTWEPERCNNEELGLGRISPVGSFPAGVSPYGAQDMAGNVWEWCATEWLKKYPYDLEDEWAEAYLERDVARAARGGSWSSSGKKYVRGAYRGISFVPRGRFIALGLRVASHSPTRPES